MSYDLTQPIGIAAAEEIHVPVTRKDTDLLKPQPAHLKCPECGQICMGPTGLGVHRSTKHGVKPRKPNYKRKKTAKPRVGQVLAKALAEEDQPWTTDEIFTSVVSMLYPTGTLPLQALTALIEWRSDTERMLRSLP